MEESKKQENIILSIDVGLVKLGYCVMNSDLKMLELNDINLKDYEDKKAMVDF